MISKLNRTLQVRRMTTKDCDAAPLEIIEAITEVVVEKLGEQNLESISDYDIRKVYADSYVMRQRGTDFIDGNAVVQNFNDKENPYLFFVPMYSWLAAGHEQTLQERVCLGYGENNVALIDFDIDYFRCDHSNGNDIHFGDRKLSTHKITCTILHELGHSLYGLGNHKKPYRFCTMSVTTNVQHYCMRCKKKAKNIEYAINKF